MARGFVGKNVETVNGRALTPARGTLLRIRRGSKLASVALAATVAAVGALALDPSMVRSTFVTRGVALVAAPLALIMAVRTFAAFWRGPELMHFPMEYAVVCHGAEAASVRAVAALRGPLGGAGYVHRARLVLPVAAWLGAAALLGGVAAGVAKPATLLGEGALLALVVAARAVLPARPFWYREHRDGSVVLYPASVTGHVAYLRAQDRGAGERPARSG